jgi:trk system potassium uptake protein TrkH
MGGMVIAALPFAFHFGIFSKYVHAMREIKEILVFIILLTIGIFLFILIEPSFSESDWLSSVFHVISASTTTGFQFLDLSHLSDNGKLLIIVLMLIGGTAFSTAGGIKIARLLLIFNKLINNKNKKSKYYFNNKNSTSLPPLISATAIQFRKRIPQTLKSYYQEKVAKSNKQITCDVPLDKYKFNLLSDKAFREAVFVIVLYILFTIITALCIYFLEDNNNNKFIDVVFEATTTISNNGLSVGVINMDLNSISKLILSFNMIMGRFEIIAILYIFISKLRR